MDSGGDDDVGSPVKRGRGRPKGSTKKKAAPAKPKAKSGTGKRNAIFVSIKKACVIGFVAGRRGRPKKDEKKEDSSKEDADENEGEEDEGDD